MAATKDRDRIVVGVDGSPSSIAALRFAARIAEALDAPMEAVMVWSYPAFIDSTFPANWSPETDARTTVDTALGEAFGESPPARLTSRVIPGDAASSLVVLSETSGMLVVGSRGHGGFAGLLLGSVSSACAHYAHCPVVIIPPRSPRGAASDDPVSAVRTRDGG